MGRAVARMGDGVFSGGRGGVFFGQAVGGMTDDGEGGRALERATDGASEMMRRKMKETSFSFS